jgi:RNA polymerase sigma factor (sigma-70 family)
VRTGFEFNPTFWDAAPSITVMAPNDEFAANVRAAQKGDRVARERVLDALRPNVVRAVRLIAGPSFAWAEDAAQNALRDIDRGLEGLRDVERAHAWAYQIAVKRGLETARRERVCHVFAALQQSLGRGEGAAFDPEAARDTRDALKDAFDRLPPRLRAVAVLRLYLDLSEEQTAEHLGCSIGTVKSQLHEARRRLARDLTATGHVPAVLHPSHTTPGK